MGPRSLLFIPEKRIKKKRHVKHDLSLLSKLQTLRIKQGVANWMVPIPGNLSGSPPERFSHEIRGRYTLHHRIFYNASWANLSRWLLWYRPLVFSLLRVDSSSSPKIFCIGLDIETALDYTPVIADCNELMHSCVSTAVLDAREAFGPLDFLRAPRQFAQYALTENPSQG